MSDSDYEEAEDNKVNESVDWGDEVEVNEGSDGRNVNNRLDTIHEESYMSTVSRRPRSVEQPIVVPLDRDVSRSFSTEDGLASSFTAPNRTSDSADFNGNGSDKQRLFEAEYEKLNNSGRRLQLPETFNAESYNKKNLNPNNSWDKGPYVHKRTPPTTPPRIRGVEEKITPVRPRSEQQYIMPRTQLKKSQENSLKTATSTPKTQKEATSRLPDWDLSCINATQNITQANASTTMNNTSGIPVQAIAQNLDKLPADAKTEDIFVVLERIRLDKLNKQARRDQDRNSFLSSLKPVKKPAETAQRLATLEEEKHDTSTRSSIRSSISSHKSIKQNNSQKSLRQNSSQTSLKSQTVEVAPQSHITRQIIHSSHAPESIIPYSQAVRVDNTIYVSGVIGLKPKSMKLEDGIENQTRRTLLNIGEVLNAAGVGFENVIKTTIFLSNMNNYQAVSRVYRQYFRDKFPAHDVYGITELPHKALIKIEVIAIVGTIRDI